MPVASDAASGGVPGRIPEGRSARIPFRVGNYEVAMRIGQGGAGSVYVCRRVDAPAPKPLLTIKVIRQHALEKQVALHAFKREARVGELLQHPNAQTVLDVGVYEEQPFLILPYVEGTNLAALLTEGSRPAPGFVVTMLLDVLRGLQHAHDIKDEKGHLLGLVHGDVSPDNVLIGIDGVARLTDFGSSRFSDVNGGRDSETFGLGKPSHMAPEQLRGEPLDGRADIFAVGVLMWTALTGQKLFSGDTYDETVMRVMRKKIPLPSSLGAPACLDDVCLQALSRSADARYATADDMADALITAATKEDLIDSRERVGHWVRREVASTLAERRRHIELMFGDKVKTPGPVLAPQQVIRSRSAADVFPSAQRPAPTIQMNATELMTGDGMGATKTLPTRTVLMTPDNLGPLGSAQPARTVLMTPEHLGPLDGAQPARSQLTRRQWYIVAAVSLATFLLTLVIGTWISGALFPRAVAVSPGVPPSAVRR